MITATPTPRPTPEAERFLGELGGDNRPRFWTRVERGHYLPLLLTDEGTCGGLMVASLVEHDDGPELRLELSTSPGWAAARRDDMMDLIEQLARRLGARRVTFEAKRRGWERLAEALGFTATRITRYERTA